MARLAPKLLTLKECERTELEKLLNCHSTPQQIVKQGIVESISPRHVGRLLEEAQIKPHQSRYWLTPPLDDEFEAKAQNISNLYITAIERAVVGERTVCIDEMTGIQAIERKEKDLPLRPGKVKRREFEYIRHGTQALIANLDVVENTGSFFN